ncbi:MAG: hypothetical protein IT168_32490 [Bryobacterales bacterium]|nr:hypothetical protein [Bryobacterales bacterium]
MRWLLTVAVATAPLFVGAALQQGRTDELVRLRDTLKSLESQVLTLNVEVIRLKLELRRSAALALSGDLEQVRVDELWLNEADQARRHDLHDIEQMLVAPDLTDAQRLEVEATRAELGVARAREIDQQLDALRARQAGLQQRLKTEQDQITRLTQELRRLSGGTQ